MSIDPNDLPGADEEVVVAKDGSKWFPENYVQELRKENMTRRFKQRELETQLKDTTTQGDAKLVAEIRDLKVGQALTETAIKLGANPRLVKATLLMDGHLANLDPSKVDFLPALEALVQTAVQNEPTLKGAPTTSTIPTRAGSDITAPGTSTPLGRSVSRADLAVLKAEGREGDIAQLYKSGQLDHLLKGEV
jgi:hypothetical protein